MNVHKDRRDGVAVVTLAQGKANALNLETLLDLDETLISLDPRQDRAMVLTGAGRMFCAGVDLHRLLAEGDDYCIEFLAALEGCLRRLFLLPIPTVAAINGHAIAGGCILAACCDHRIMDPGPCKIGVTELLVGVPFPRIAMEILRFTLAPGSFESMVYSGLLLTPTEAQACQLVDDVAAEVVDRSVQVAAKLVEIPAKTFALTKMQIRSPVRALWDGESDAEHKELVDLWQSPAIREAIRSYMESIAIKSAR